MGQGTGRPGEWDGANGVVTALVTAAALATAALATAALVTG